MDRYCAATLSGGHTNTVWGIGVSYDLPKIVSCSGDNSIVVWGNDSPDFNSTWRITERFDNLQKFSVYSIDWSHDHGRIVSGAGDNSIVLLYKDSSDSSQSIVEESRIINAHDNDVNCVRWNPHSRYQHLLASAGDDGKIKIWEFRQE